MTYNHASTRAKDGNPFAQVDDDGHAPNGTAPAVPAPAAGSDFAASAAMVNDILAAGPTEGAERQSPATTEAVSTARSEPALSQPTGMAPSSDFFVSARRRKSVGQTKHRKSFWQKQLGAKRSQSDFFADARHKKPFWQKQLSFGKSRKTSRSESR